MLVAAYEPIILLRVLVFLNGAADVVRLVCGQSVDFVPYDVLPQSLLTI
jgi:hypothetical protein